jgi:hypothetical protein
MEEKEVIGKRVNLNIKNIKRIKIMGTLLENEVQGLNEKKKLDYIINKAIESYYSSDEIKKLLDL